VVKKFEVGAAVIFSVPSSHPTVIKFDFVLSKRQTLRKSPVEGKVKVKAIPLQAWTCPEVSKRLRLPDFMTIDT
jgi:hypothetical protein